MDCFELAGSKPMTPAPPKVWPVWPVAPVPLPVAPGGVLPLESEPLVGVPPVELLLVLELSVGPEGVAVVLLFELDESKEEPLPTPGEPNPPTPAPFIPGTPLPPLGPMPPIELPVASGCPKNPMAMGTLFWPNMIGFQSSLPVIGSIYFLRRKRMSLVLTSASAEGG